MFMLVRFILCTALISVSSLVLAAPQQFSSCDEKLLGTLAQYESQIWEELGPLMSVVNEFSSNEAPAQSIDELQAQLLKLENNEYIKSEYLRVADVLNRVAPEFEIIGPAGISNFHEVIPGVYRSANPTMEQVEELMANGIVDHFFALNKELDMWMVGLDPGHTLPLTEDRKSVMKTELLSQGHASTTIDRWLLFYESIFPYAQGVVRGDFDFATHFPAFRASKHIGHFFAALDKLILLRSRGQRVLFHCHIGRHRTGLLAALVKSLHAGRALSEQDLKSIYIEFVKWNWNDNPDTRLYYIIHLPLILKSQPFQRVFRNWHSLES